MVFVASFYFLNKIMKSDMEMIPVDIKCLDPSITLGLMPPGM